MPTRCVKSNVHVDEELMTVLQAALRAERDTLLAEKAAWAEANADAAQTIQLQTTIQEHEKKLAKYQEDNRKIIAQSVRVSNDGTCIRIIADRLIVAKLPRQAPRIAEREG